MKISPRLFEIKICNTVSIIICDDHHLAREGIIKIINEFKNCTIIGEVSQGDELFSVFRAEKIPDIVLLNIHMPPGISRYDVVKRIRKEFKTVKIIILSIYKDLRVMEGILSIGAVGFISKCAPK